MSGRRNLLHAVVRAAMLGLALAFLAGCQSWPPSFAPGWSGSNLLTPLRRVPPQWEPPLDENSTTAEQTSQVLPRPNRPTRHPVTVRNA